MIWAVAVAVLLGIVAFFVYLAVLAPRKLERYGAVEVPGDATVELPAGGVGVFYEDAKRWKRSERAQVAPGFSVAVNDGSGSPLEIAAPASDTIIKSGGRNRIPYGRLTVPRPGRYRVSTEVHMAAEQPRVTFGEAS